MAYESKRQRYEILRTQLENERSTFLPRYRDLADYILPTRPRFFAMEGNRGDRKNQKIIDSTATLAIRTMRAGMVSGITSPARPWFRLSTPDPDMANFGAVKEWLEVVTQRMFTTFNHSNIYNILPICYGDLGTFGTAPISLEEDFKSTLRASSFPVGSYSISNNNRLTVDTFMREFRMTVRQVVEKFGQTNDGGKINWDNFSQYIKDLWERGQTELWVTVCHVIKPNEDYNPKMLQAKYKKYTSCYYEKGLSNGSSQNYLNGDGPDTDRYLSESGYDYFPILCPRWEITGEDVYGTDCPGMTAIGDIKQLQMGERRAAQAIEKMVNPPMVAPSSLKNSKASILPGDITYVDDRNGQGFKTAHEVSVSLNELEGKQQQIRSRIQRSFYEDLFLMLSQSDRREITAREVDERHEEKLLALGPVLEQLNQDLLDPLIDISFDIMNRQGLIPPPPQELQGQKLKVDYISIMAQAQKLIGISGIERFTGFVNNLGTVQPSAFDKINTDKLVDRYGDMTSIPSGIVRPDEEVQMIRGQRAQQMQAAQRQQSMAEGANTAKTLAETNMTNDSALRRMVQQVQGA